jgi:fructokinase
VSRIVALGEVVADIYRDESESSVELPFTARPGGAPANALAFVEVAEDGDRSFTFYRSNPAADELLSPEDITEDLVSGASFVNFGSIPLLRDPAASAVHEISRLAASREVPVAFDVNLRVHLWESAGAARAAVDPLLDRSTIVKMGDDELEPLLGRPAPEEAAKMLLNRGVSLVLVSLGSEGAFYATESYEGRVPAYPVEVVDATGAGDAFLAATLVHLAGAGWEEERVREAVLRGTAAGSLACTSFGAMSGLPTRDELEQFVSRGG